MRFGVNFFHNQKYHSVFLILYISIDVFLVQFKNKQAYIIVRFKEKKNLRKKGLRKKKLVPIISLFLASYIVSFSK